jgi:hypothetical protein
MRNASGRRLGSERKKLEAAGKEVVLIQPTAEDLEIMGGNLMSRKRRHEVIERSIRTVAEQLRRPDVRELLADLPPGDPDRIRKPQGPPSEWPLPTWAAGAESSVA